MDASSPLDADTHLPAAAAPGSAFSSAAAAAPRTRPAQPEAPDPLRPSRPRAAEYSPTEPAGISFTSSQRAPGSRPAPTSGATPTRTPRPAATSAPEPGPPSDPIRYASSPHAANATTPSLTSGAARPASGDPVPRSEARTSAGQHTPTPAPQKPAPAQYPGSEGGSSGYTFASSTRPPAPPAPTPAPSQVSAWGTSAVGERSGATGTPPPPTASAPASAPSPGASAPRSGPGYAFTDAETASWTNLLGDTTGIRSTTTTSSYAAIDAGDAYRSSQPNATRRTPHDDSLASYSFARPDAATPASAPGEPADPWARPPASGTSGTPIPPTSDADKDRSAPSSPYLGATAIAAGTLGASAAAAGTLGSAPPLGAATYLSAPPTPPRPAAKYDPLADMSSWRSAPVDDADAETALAARQTSGEPGGATQVMGSVDGRPEPGDPVAPPSSRRPSRAIAPENDDAEKPRGFGPALGWTLGSTLIPGLGLIRTRRRVIGWVMLLVFVAAATAAVAAWATSPTALLAVASPTSLLVAAIALAVFGVAWAVSVVVTHLSLRPRNPPGWQRAVGGIAVAILSALVLLPTAVGARALYDTSTMLTGIFGEQAPGSEPTESFGNAADPWANKARLNVLILGGDSGQNRADAVGARTDTVILASINTSTGDTVLFSLPRQTQRIPFSAGSALAKKWPNGFTDGVANDAEYFLNAIYHNVPTLARDAIPAGTEDAGAYALKDGVGTALGLPIDYYAMINMDGFIELVNALGGITVNISTPVAVGGKTTGDVPPDRWLPPGPDQHLNGWDALWYARGRYGAASGDYDRMARQRCVVQAVVKQANPTTVLANYEALTKAGSNIIATDAPSSMAPALLALALKVREGTMTSVSFENDKDGFSTVRPNWDSARSRVQAAISVPAATPETSASEPAATASSAPATSATSAPPATNSGGAASVVDECAYNPK